MNQCTNHYILACVLFNCTDYFYTALGLTLIISLLGKLDCQLGLHYFKYKERLTYHILMQTTRKRNCPTTITIWEFEVFPEYGYSAEELKQMSDYALQKFKLAKLENLKMH